MELRNQFTEIIKAQNLWGFYSWTFTLTDRIRAWIDRNPDIAGAFLKDVRRAVSRTIKGALGVGHKDRGIQPGFSVMFHPSSSGNPFVQSSHFHSLVLPLLVNRKNRTVKRFEKRIDHATVKAIYRRELGAVLDKWGMGLLVEKAYVVHLEWIEKDLGSKVNHEFKYANRSQAEDVLKRIQRVDVDLKTYVCVMHDKAEDVYRPELKTQEDILIALERAMDPEIQIRMSYGFLRVLDQYADLLGVERKDFEPDDQWAKLFDVDIIRLWEPSFDEKAGKVRGHLILLIRKKGEFDTLVRLRPEDLGGERVCMSDRRIFKAKGV